MTIAIDDIDRRILRALGEDGRMSIVQLAERVGDIVPEGLHPPSIPLRTVSGALARPPGAARTADGRPFWDDDYNLVRSAEVPAGERVFDVVCADDRQPDANHRCPPIGPTVDLQDCSLDITKGDVALRGVWTDPEFDASERAFYYLRVLETPTCRWSTWDAVRLGIEPNPKLPRTQQDRAWTSPIWYDPDQR